MFYVTGFDTFDNNGATYNEAYSSSPFIWYTGTTNMDSSDTITTHQAGHADNGEDLVFRTRRVLGSAFPGANYLRLEFRLVGPRSWTSPVDMMFTFMRLM